jgi:hypothetical protein
MVPCWPRHLRRTQSVPGVSAQTAQRCTIISDRMARKPFRRQTRPFRGGVRSADRRRTESKCGDSHGLLLQYCTMKYLYMSCAAMLVGPIGVPAALFAVYSAPVVLPGFLGFGFLGLRAVTDPNGSVCYPSC